MRGFHDELFPRLFPSIIFSKFCLLVTSSLVKKKMKIENLCSVVLLSKTKFFPRNTKNTDKNRINKQSTHKHTSHTEKYNS